jgi:hypothetical protein
MKKLLFIVLLAFGIIGAANAQQPQALIVATCGTPPISYVAGTYGILTMDTTGKLCDSGSGGGGGTVTANQGTAGSSAWLVTGTGGTFPVTGTFWPYTLGQQLAAASVPVVLTAAQLSTLTPAPAITGFATQTTLAAILAAQGAAPAQQTGATVGVVAGSAVIGKVGIDQTTPGTTNGVQVNSSVLPTGAATQTTLAAILAAQGAAPAQQTGATVTSNQGTPGASAWPVSLPTTPTVAAGSGAVPVPSSESAAGLSTVASATLETSHVIKNGAGNLYAFNISADSTLSGAAWWLLIFNATSAPGDGAVTPAKCYALASGTTSYSAAWDIAPLYFSTGITIVVSTTGCFTKTASAHAFISGDYK